MNEQGKVCGWNDCETTEKYWDCECDLDYIKPKTLFVCPVCGWNQTECPDSRLDEVKKLGLK